MKVFLSWSGDLSHAIAQGFREWLPTVIQTVQPWISSQDISKGAAWLPEIRGALGETNGVGLFFLTKAALQSPWLLFEAGGIAALDRERVCTICVDMKPHELTPPLSLFQATKLEREDVKKLVQDLNKHLSQPLDAAVPEKTFARAWPDLEQALEQVLSKAPSKAIDAKDGHKTGAGVAELNGVMEALRRIEARLGKIEQHQQQALSPPLLVAGGALRPIGIAGTELVAPQVGQGFLAGQSPVSSALLGQVLTVGQGALGSVSGSTGTLDVARVGLGVGVQQPLGIAPTSAASSGVTFGGIPPASVPSAPPKKKS